MIPVERVPVSGRRICDILCDVNPGSSRYADRKNPKANGKLQTTISTIIEAANYTNDMRETDMRQSAKDI